MCDEHLAEWNRWFDYRLVAPFKINSGASYDDSVKGVMEARARRVREWRETITFHQRLIADICARTCQAVSGAAPAVAEAAVA